MDLLSANAMSSTLHTLNQVSAIELAQAHFADGDALLLLEDGVLLLMHAERLPQVPCYVLRPDAEARALEIEPNSPVTLIDYAQFVDLSLRYARVIAWS